MYVYVYVSVCVCIVHRALFQQEGAPDRRGGENVSFGKRYVIGR
jgi:hypothetical protein